MPELINFPHERLWVGYRGLDWTRVYFHVIKEVVGKGDDEREIDVFVYSTEGGDKVWKAPREGEIRWHAFYDPKSFDSTRWNDKLDLQQEYLKKGYDYLKEKNPAMIKAMESDLNNPRYVRWQTWFEDAKKWKKARTNRRRKRIAGMRAAGIPEREIKDQVTSDTSDDSAYGSDSSGDDDDDRPMRPPPRPAAGRKRQAPGNARNGNTYGSKQPRVSTNGTGQHRANSTMRGARGSSQGTAGASRHGNLDGFVVSDEDDDDDIDDESDIFDRRAPDSRSPSVLNGLLRTPPNSRRRPTGGHGLGSSAERNVENDDSQDARARADGSNGMNGGRPQGWLDGVSNYNGTNDDGQGLTEEEAIERAVRASEAPEDHDRDGVRSSIEHDDDAASEH